MAALPLQNRISQSSSSQREFRILKSDFGNGYDQRRKDGINNRVGSWSISWENLTQSEHDTIISALEATDGVAYLTWQSPIDTSIKKWIIAGYNSQALSGNIYNISSDLREVFEV